MAPEENSEQEAFVRGFHGIPDSAKLESLSFSELASELSTTESGSPKFIVIEREMKKHLAKDQANINLKNVIIGGIMVGIFGLSGVVLGWWLRDSSTIHKPSGGGSEYQIQQGKLGNNENTTRTPIPKPIHAQPIAVPEKVENNAQPNQ